MSTRNGFTVEEYLRGMLQPGDPVFCPWHDDSDASCSILPGSHRLYCHRCDISEDRLGVARLLWFSNERRSVGFRLARQALLELGDGPLTAPTRGITGPKTIEIPEDIDDVRTVMTQFCRIACNTLRSDEGTLRYLRTKRGVRYPIKRGLGIAPPSLPSGVFAHVDDEIMIRAGIFYDARDGRQPGYRLSGRLILPEVRGKQVVFYQARAMDDRKPKYTNPRLPIHPWGLETLVDRKTGELHDPVFIAEGIFDVLPLAEAGHPVLAICGANLALHPEIPLLIGARRVVILADRDTPTEQNIFGVGWDKAHKVKEALAATAHPVVTQTPPEYKDLGEWLASVGIEEVVARLTWDLSTVF